MADAATIEFAPLAVTAADLTLPDGPLALDAVTLAPVEAQARYSLRARDAGLLAETLGRALPAHIGEVLDDVIRLGPD
ncbi:hypothetical protein ABTM15_20110, partial [Acinetobacter baumannii]